MHLLMALTVEGSPLGKVPKRLKAQTGNAGSDADGPRANGPEPLWGRADADGPGDLRRADAGALSRQSCLVANRVGLIRYVFLRSRVMSAARLPWKVGSDPLAATVAHAAHFFGA